jgi:hypothetical protein
MEPNNTSTVRSKIQQKCGIIFFFMIVVSIFVKTNLFRALDEDIHDWLAFLPEAFCVVAIYYIYLFWHAKKGIVLGVKVETAELEKFPIWRYAKISLIISVIIAAAPLLFRMLIAFVVVPYEAMMVFWLVLIFAAFLFPLSFIVLYLNFYIAYRIARRHAVVTTASADE